tara:strand:+ start:557 stop:1183 length:627 start_codon:yes stop_codon:yes gene_type:complete
MAYGPKAFLRDLAVYSTGAAVGAKNSAKFASYAARQGIQLAGVGARAAAPIATNPVVAGTALGLGALATPPGQDLLEAARLRGRADRIALQQAIDERLFELTVLPFRQQQAAQQGGTMPIDIQVSDPGGRQNIRDQSLIRPRPQTTHNRNVKTAMKAVKDSKFGGPKGKISNARATFSKVNKTISRLKKGRKVSRKGITGVIARAIKK